MPKRFAPHACAGCGETTTNPQYCSNQCQASQRYSIARKTIVATGVVPAGVSGHCRHASRYLIETRGHRCELCGLSEWRSAPIPLVLDHIDGDSQNWAIENLRHVCGNCDMQLPTYKNR